MGKQNTKYGSIIVLIYCVISSVAAQQCSKVINEQWVDLNNYTTDEITLSCSTGFTVNIQYVKLVQAYKEQTGVEIMQECVIEPIYQYHSLCLGKNKCVLANPSPDYYRDIRGCYDEGNGTNYFRMEYFCDANASVSEEMSICDTTAWTGSQLYLYSSPPGSPAITNTNCKCIIKVEPQTEVAAYVGTFTKESSIEGFNLNRNPCQQKVQMTTFHAFEDAYVQRSFCSRFAGLAREKCSDRMKIIYLEFSSITSWVSVNFSLSFSSPADKPMKVECGITDLVGRPTDPPTSTIRTTTTTPLPTTTTPTTTTTEATTTTPPTTTEATTTTTTARTTTTERVTTSAATTPTDVPTTSQTPTPGSATPAVANEPLDPDTSNKAIPIPTEDPGQNDTSPAAVDKKTGELPIVLIVGITGGVMGAFILIGMIAAAVCAKRRKTDDKGSGAAGAQLSGDGSVYHVYEYVEPGARYSGVYAQPDEASIPPVYPSYPRPMPDTLSSTPGYLDPPPDYPTDTLENQRNEQLQQSTALRRPPHHDHSTTATRTTTATSKKHARFDRDVEYIQQEEDVAHNPLYGKAHDLFFAY